MQLAIPLCREYLRFFFARGCSEPSLRPLARSLIVLSSHTKVGETLNFDLRTIIVVEVTSDSKGRERFRRPLHPGQ